ncbi:Syntaxin-31 [Phytophthora nicotianae]|uniref:Syntaxin-31 n=1 Tax=Phytophthora nicotianae TaxID=4792 RepID=A0A0W8DAP2_PHYNI|nr:Syntaxin-31 [Phytophthora nicotianae]
MWSASAALFALVALIGFLSVCIATLMTMFGPGIDRQNTRRGAPHTASHQEFLLSHVHAGNEESGLMERPRPNGELVRLFYRFWLPRHLDSAKDAKAVVVVLHGVNSHSARNNSFMVEVLQHGFLVAGMDHEGMGRSDGRHGYFSSIDLLVDDAIAFIDLVKVKYPHKKIFLLGAVIREEGGKMYLEEKEWMLAYNEFFESFRNYQEAGNARAKQCLKYVVLANMLASSDINPFDSREAKVYQDVEEIGAMLLLRGAYEANDVVQFEKILKNPKYKLLSDPIMKRYLNPLLRNIRCQVMKKLVRPYQAIRIDSLSKSMNITSEDVEDIAVALIQNLELDAKIDQSRGLLVLQTRQKARDASKMYDSLDRWTRALASTHATIAARVTAHP